MATILDSSSKGYFHCHRKFCWTFCSRMWHSVQILKKYNTPLPISLYITFLSWLALKCPSNIFLKSEKDETFDIRVQVSAPCTKFRRVSLFLHQ